MTYGGDHGESTSIALDANPSDASHAPAVRRERTGDRARQAAELLGRHVTRLLRVVSLESTGRVVHPDGYRVDGRAPSPAPEARGRGADRYEELSGFARHEPRLKLIAKSLERALDVGSFLGPGGPLTVNGFRLANLRTWARQPTPDLLSNMGSLSSYCDCKCDFCFEKSNDAKKRSGISFGRAQLGLAEASTRARYYSPEDRKGLPMSSRFTLEPFVNPRCLAILDLIRGVAPHEFLNLTTNGAALDEEVVAHLARLKPILVAVSLNAGSVAVRYETMRDRSKEAAETAMACMPLLKKYGIPFVGSYVPWPSKPLSDLEEAVRHFERNDAIAARICLPSWTRFSFSEPPFDAKVYWPQIVEVVQRLRETAEIPIHLMPNMYQLQTTKPFIQGAIRHSPAAVAGMRYGDLITAIDGEPVYTRPQASGILAQRAKAPSLRHTRFGIERAGKSLEVTVPHPQHAEELDYPFRQLVESGSSRMWAGTLGIHLADGFALTDFLKLRDIVLENERKKILLFVSELGVPYFLEGMTMIGEQANFLERADVFVETLRPEYWSGNVVLGDLWVVEDVVRGTREWMQRQGIKPDVVVVPSSFLSLAGHDLLGRCFVDAEHELDLEVRLLPCNPISI